MDGLGYSGQNSSAIATDQRFTTGGIGGLNLNLSSAGVGGFRVPTWAWYAGAALAAFVVYKKFK
jgi:hypothetical protein